MSEKKRNYRPLMLFLSVVLLVFGVVGGTYAWLIDETETVENTFTYGDINITLEESKTDEKGNLINAAGNIVSTREDAEKTTTGNEYKIVPGRTYTKDPTVTVAKDSEACWLFVKVEKKALPPILTKIMWCTN